MKPYYERDGIVIYHGDSQEILPVLPKFDLLLTDPPYGIGFAGTLTKWSRDNLLREKKNWDDEAPKLDLLLDLKITTMIWGGNHFALPPSRGWLVWVKPTRLPSYGDAELCWTNIEMPVRHKMHDGCNREKLNHPTQKPLDLIKWCFSFSPQSSHILDPFMGSGTTLRAAKDLGKKAVGIETVEEYCEMAANRLSQEVLGLGT